MPESAPSLFAAEVLVFGAGSFGQRVATTCVERGMSVVAIVDRDESREVGEHRYMRLDAEVVRGRQVLLGVHNPGADLMRIASELMQAGAKSVLTPPMILEALGEHGRALANYWLAPSPFPVSEQHVARARSLLSDEASLRCFDRTIRYRRWGRIEDSTPEQSLQQQYLPDDIDFLTDRMRFVDVGAFDGDTIRALRGHARIADQMAALFALEPDLQNYGRVVAELARWPHLRWQAAPLAASDRAESLRFASEPGGAASISATGDAAVQAVALDDLLLHWEPTHIKMDIEGAEPAALLGLLRTIRVHRPRLAVSVYHAPEHHWSIIEWLNELQVGYRFHMRAYGQQTFDTVLYAIPE